MKVMQGRMVTGNGVLNATVDGTPYTVPTDHPNYGKLKKHFNDKNGDAFIEALDVVKEAVKAVQNTGTTKVVVDTTGVYLEGKPVHNTVSSAIMKMLQGGYDFTPMVKFLERVLQNPSRRSVEELWGFLEVNGLMITEDGCFLAYKSVSSNYLDKYSGTFDNTPGAVLRMARNQVDDDFTRTCSHGFHVGALAYSGPSGWYHGGGDRVIICKIAPEDVVSVPNDHNCQKLRTCAYEVVGDYKAPLNAPVYSGKVDDSYDAVDSCFVNEDEWVTELSAEDMLVGHTYTFEYNGEVRVGVLLDRHAGLYHMIMSKDDKSEFQHRNFKEDEIVEVEEGSSPDRELSSGEDDDYGDEDDGEPYYPKF